MKHYLIPFLISSLIPLGSIGQSVLVKTYPVKLNESINTGAEPGAIVLRNAKVALVVMSGSTLAVTGSS